MCLDLCPQSALKPPCILGLVCFDLFGYNWEKTMFLKWFWKKAVYKICLFVLQKEWQSIILDESYQILFKSIILNQIGNKISFLKYYFYPSFGALCRLCKVWKSEWASKVSFFHQCSKMQIIPIKKIIIHTGFFQFLWFFILKVDLKVRYYLEFTKPT